jgi:hypothetical protein
MLWYRCYLREGNGNVASRREFEAHDDSEALTLATELHAIYAECATSHGGWYLRQGRRVVSRSNYLDQLRAAAKRRRRLRVARRTRRPSIQR